jgi:hypothetical protein
MKTTLESAVRLNDHYGEPGPPEEPIFLEVTIISTSTSSPFLSSITASETF